MHRKGREGVRGCQYVKDLQDVSLLETCVIFLRNREKNVSIGTKLHLLLKVTHHATDYREEPAAVVNCNDRLQNEKRNNINAT